MTVQAIIMPEGEHVQITDEGVLVLGQYGRSVTVECGCAECGCTSRLGLRMCSDAPIADDDECDALTDDYLRQLGWAVDPLLRSSDVCPACA